MILIALAIAAALGLADTAYLIRQRYASRRPLVCPFGQRCDIVLNSRYGRAIGFRNEFLGAAYYAAMLVLFAFAERGRALPFAVFGTFDPLALAFYLSVPALAASFVLTAIQVFVLRNYCSWCLLANALNAFLFFGLLALG